jgi:large subunit ribosomal protein L3
MSVGLLGRKLGTTRVFDSNGLSVPVTVVEAGPCWVVQRKTVESDGYDAVQLGFGEKNKGVNKPQAGHFKKHGVKPARFLKEVAVEPGSDMKPGDILTVDIFKEGDRVDVTGTSKGRGFQGVVKRHGFRGGRSTRGSMFHRAPGSIGASADPSRVLKNTALPGRMGGERVTRSNLLVVRVDSEQSLLLVKGDVPGPTGGNLILMKSVRSAKGG